MATGSVQQKRGKSTFSRMKNGTSSWVPMRVCTTTAATIASFLPGNSRLQSGLRSLIR